MTKANKKILIITAILAAIGLAVYYFLKRKKAAETEIKQALTPYSIREVEVKTTPAFQNLGNLVQVTPTPSITPTTPIGTPVTGTPVTGVAVSGVSVLPPQNTQPVGTVVGTPINLNVLPRI